MCLRVNDSIKRSVGLLSMFDTPADAFLLSLVQGRSA